jgi:hypothetical protein
MTQAYVPIPSARPDGWDPAASRPDLDRENQALKAELEQLEPLVSAALLTATAFRLRDHDALIGALRLLVRAIRVFEDHHACA